LKQTKQQKLSILNHILEHLKENSIHIETAIGGWYSGNKEQFVKRHKRSIKHVEDQIRELES
jgi:hypothetical protein